MSMDYETAKTCSNLRPPVYKVIKDHLLIKTTFYRATAQKDIRSMLSLNLYIKTTCI